MLKEPGLMFSQTESSSLCLPRISLVSDAPSLWLLCPLNKHSVTPLQEHHLFNEWRN